MRRDFLAKPRHLASEFVVLGADRGASTIAVTETLWTEIDERTCRLAEPGQYFIVPRGAWHTARPRVATRLLFVTPGQGMENRERLPWDGGEP
jgi:hypothetical protein